VRDKTLRNGVAGLPSFLHVLKGTSGLGSLHLQLRVRGKVGHKDRGIKGTHLVPWDKFKKKMQLSKNKPWKRQNCCNQKNNPGKLGGRRNYSVPKGDRSPWDLGPKVGVGGQGPMQLSNPTVGSEQRRCPWDKHARCDVHRDIWFCGSRDPLTPLLDPAGTGTYSPRTRHKRRPLSPKESIGRLIPREHRKSTDNTVCGGQGG